MSDDLKLMEMAAKAAGLKLLKSPVYAGALTIRSGDGDYEAWNPLAYDDDAFRLAVKLGLSIEVLYDTSQPLPWLRVIHRKRGGYEQWEHCGVKDYAADPAAATRRAIVRAAAISAWGAK